MQSKKQIDYKVILFYLITILIWSVLVYFGEEISNRAGQVMFLIGILLIFMPLVVVTSVKLNGRITEGMNFFAPFIGAISILNIFFYENFFTDVMWVDWTLTMICSYIVAAAVFIGFKIFLEKTMLKDTNKAK